MKLHVMHDQSGKIVAAVRLDEDRSLPSRFGQRVTGVRPVPTKGLTGVDLDVPAEHAHLSFEEACRQLMVGTSGGKPHFKLRRGEKPERT